MNDQSLSSVSFEKAMSTTIRRPKFDFKYIREPKGNKAPNINNTDVKLKK